LAKINTFYSGMLSKWQYVNWFWWGY
jgi:hypothetical protein